MSRVGRIAISLALAAAACNSSAAPTDEPGGEPPDAGSEAPTPYPYPDPDWTTGDPADQGLDPAGLDAAATAAEDADSYCLLVVRHGVLVYERYFGGTDASTANKSWSIAKSYTSTLVGIAIDRGDVGGLEDPAADYLPEWAGTERQAITVRDLVSMTSGLQWSAFQDYGQMVLLTKDQTGFALDLGLENDPGSSWTYNNGAVQVLEPLLRRATGMSIEQYAERHLWSRIGMTASWAKDRSGNPTAYANVMASCRDQARFGYLYLRRGRWSGGEQVVPESWVDQALTPSQDMNRGYGFLFWLNGEAPTMTAMMEQKDEKLVPFAPDDLFAAQGFGNQFIDVIPSLDLIVVRFGADPMSTFDPGALIDDARFDKHAAILQPILDAVQ